LLLEANYSSGTNYVLPITYWCEHAHLLFVRKLTWVVLMASNQILHKEHAKIPKTNIVQQRTSNTVLVILEYSLASQLGSLNR